jgi:hypothetical protein
MVEIEFITSGWSSELGGFATGERRFCTKDQAEHFVGPAACAKYVQSDGSGAGQVEPAADAAPQKAAKKAKG